MKMFDKVIVEDENEYQNWYWNPVSSCWVRHCNKRKDPKKPKTEYSQDNLIWELKNVFCKGRYRSWTGQ